MFGELAKAAGFCGLVYAPGILSSFGTGGLGELAAIVTGEDRCNVEGLMSRCFMSAEEIL